MRSNFWVKGPDPEGTNERKPTHRRRPGGYLRMLGVCQEKGIFHRQSITHSRTNKYNKSNKQTWLLHTLSRQSRWAKRQSKWDKKPPTQSNHMCRSLQKIPFHTESTRRPELWTILSRLLMYFYLCETRNVFVNDNIHSFILFLSENFISNRTSFYSLKATVESVKHTVETVTNTVGAANQYAKDKAAAAYNRVIVIVNGATTTITSLTPTPIVKLVQATIDSASSLRQDPVGTGMMFFFIIMVCSSKF